MSLLVERSLLTSEILGSNSLTGIPIFKVNCNFWKTKINKKTPRMAHFWKKRIKCFPETFLCDLLDFGQILAPINLPKYSTFLGNFCKGEKIFNFLEKSFLGNFLKTFGNFYSSHWSWSCSKRLVQSNPDRVTTEDECPISWPQKYPKIYSC